MGPLRGRTREHLKPLVSLEGNNSVRVSCGHKRKSAPKSHPDFLSAEELMPSSHHDVLLSAALEAEPVEAS